MITDTWDIIYARLDRPEALQTEAAELAAAWKAESEYDSCAADQAETMRKGQHERSSGLPQVVQPNMAQAGAPTSRSKSR